MSSVKASVYKGLRVVWGGNFGKNGVFLMVEKCKKWLKMGVCPNTLPNIFMVKLGYILEMMEI